jgi:hypothetical protein
MTFTASTSPDITEAIPTPLTLAQAASLAATNRGARFDVTVGGIGFTLAANDQNPYVRQTAPVQKQQFDSSKEAGEQTLDGDWVRSQTSWHHGAGTRFYEPGSDPASQYRFADSLGVDVMTRDRVTMLKKTDKIGTVAADELALVTGAVVGGVDTLFTTENGNVKRYGYSDHEYGIPASGAVLTAPVLAGAKILAGTADAICSAPTTGTTITDLWTGAASVPTPYWVKSRIIAVTGVDLWELTLAGGAWPTTPLYSHPDAGWTWSAVTEAPTAILAAGYSNGRSSIFRFALQDAASGSTPELSQAYQVAEFPVGEEVLSLHVHLGTFVGIGTTKGIRVGLISADGQIQYGPLLVECGPVRDIDAADRFLYGAVTAAHPDGNSGAVVVDLSEEVEQNTLRFPYAWHARSGTPGRVDTVAVFGASGRVALGVFGEGVYLQSATDYEAQGWVTSGRIRFSTVQTKQFRTADLGVEIPDGSVTLSVVQSDGDEVAIRNLTPSSENGRGIALRAGSPVPVEYLQIKVAFTAGATGSPALDSLQVRAVPVVNRQELIQYPLLCMDREQNATGKKYGKQGFAFQRFSALKSLEQTMAVVTVSDRSTGETFQAQIEQVEFRRPGPPSADGRPNWGGLLSVTVRK